ncbi:probable LRR receptor-like serine/threonine-protein kinase At3g47570 [Nicotiana sylvestris]|uniref:probable LRR receptor-like serine/threonine-protein kinase At3g47570 n=1 Tax=Nicotiana sylvestris TaxID=4096 RepID=UPI00388C5B66
MAIDMNIQELLVIGDSDLLMHQFREEWATKNSKILPCLYHVQELRKTFTKTEFQHVPRVHDGFADALANLSSMIQHPNKNFIDPIPVKIHDQPAYCAYVEEEANGKHWFHHIKEYLAKGEYPELANAIQKRTLRRIISYCLGNVTSLREIHLGSNKLSSNIPTRLGNIKDLMVHDLSTNNMGGSLPPEIGNLKAVIQMDLSMNQFTNGIPKEIGGLQNLVDLSLRHNRLQGSIPDSMSNVAGLEFLDLSHNNISGTIPKSFVKLQYLKYFNVSYNKLYGEIPSAGPFKNLSSQFFLFNEALCGSMRFRVLPCPTSSKHRSNRNRVLVLFLPLGIALVFGLITFMLVWIRYRRGKRALQQVDSLSIATRGRISYYELLQATDALSESNLIGSGSFGSVYKCILRSGTPIVVKVFNLQLEATFKSFDIECEVLRNLRHTNLMKVITSCSNLDFKDLVLEYMPNGSLDKWLYSHNYFLDIMQRLNIMVDVACALEYLYHECSSPVIHYDLKPSNCLVG